MRRQFQVERLEERNLLAADLFDRSVHWAALPDSLYADSVAEPAAAGISGQACYTSAPPPPPNLDQGSLATGAALATALFPLEETFLLHSNPTATKTIYLDFDGFLTRDTQWNIDYNLPNILTPAYNLDGDFNSFSDYERLIIQNVWERVSEDFRPFEVDVTTEDPGIEALRNTGGTDQEWGQRVIIGGDSTQDWFTPVDGRPVGGVSYGSFNWDSDTPNFVFGGDFDDAAANIAEVISHETGHALGLAHDGQFRFYRDIGEDPPEIVRLYVEYYAGHGSGATSWAPIMGVSYGKPLTQWSKSEYFNATNNEAGTGPLQDDLEIITNRDGANGNGFGYRTDDHGDASATASALTLDADGKVYSAEGIVERNTDIDYFSFTVKGLGELVSFDVDPFYNGPNLDVLAKVINSSGVEVAMSNPLNNVDASFSGLFLPAGTYYLTVEGAGRPITSVDPVFHPGPFEAEGNPPDPELPPDASDWGYSDYGSLGYYSIRGTRSPLVVGVDFDVAAGASPMNWTRFSDGGQQAGLSNLISEAGVATQYDLTIRTTGTALQSVASTNPIDVTALPLHAQPLGPLNGYLSAIGETFTFEWSNLQPSDVYQIYVFGSASIAANNVVTITGGQWNGETQTYDFTQVIAPNDLVVNNDQSPGGQELATLSYLVVADLSGKITITVNGGADLASAIAGLAIAPTELGSLEGQKWNDVDGDRIRDPGEATLPGWTIYLDTNNNGQLDFISTPDEPVTAVAPNVPQNLVDYNIVKNELDFQEAGLIVDVNVTIDISHTFAADLDIYLVSPAGTRVRLTNDFGGAGNNFTNTTFDDSAVRSISSITFGEAPFTGTFRPIEPLSAFNNENASGIWTLEITDDAQGDIGVLNSWSITVLVAGVDIYLEPFRVTDANGKYFFDDLQPGLYYVRELPLLAQIAEGWLPTWTPPPVTVTSEGKIKDIDFGNWIPVVQRGSIQGQKFNDLNGNGVKDAQEPGLAGWNIYIDSNNNGVRDTATTPTTIPSTDVPKQIKDFSQAISQVTFDGLGTVLDVEITLDVTHSFIGDLDAFLTSPSGRTVELFTGVGSQFNDLLNLTLADDAARSIGTIGSGDIPYTGRWRPEGLLSDFLGEVATGAWTLLIRDNAFADQGTLNSWSLTITAGELFKETDGNGNYLFANLPADVYVVGEEPQPGWVQVPPADTTIPAAVWANSQWTVSVAGLDDPDDPDGPDSHRNVKNVNFGNQAAPVALMGDYNLDDIVDSADYVLWRNTMGTSVAPFSGADGNGNGVIDQADHGVWRANFGNVHGGGGGSGSSLAANSAQSPAMALKTVAAPEVQELAAVVQTVAQVDVSPAQEGVSAVSDGGKSHALPVAFPAFQSTRTVVAHRPAARLRFELSAPRSDAAVLAWLASMDEGQATDPFEHGDRFADGFAIANLDGEEFQVVDSVFEALELAGLAS